MSERETLARTLAEKVDYHLTEERVAVLVADSTCDVEACPGSGKTTTLSLKAALELALLVDRSKAFLILSHTNVARREIERKAALLPDAQRILRAPHFVGTIQAFVDRFLALPFLRSSGIEVQRVDNAIASAFQSRLLTASRFSTARYALEKRSDWNVADLELGLEEGSLTFDGEPLSLSRESPTFRQLTALKQETIAAGLFRFGDMYAFAHRYLRAYPWAVTMLRRRFVLVFLDEVQDNDLRQAELLRVLFPRNGPVRVHRFGDSNQAIFGDTASGGVSADFPCNPVLPLTESRRFGSFIADVVSTVSANGQVVLGAGEDVARPHSLLLYDRDTIQNVVPKFAEIVSSTVHPGESVVVYAVGARKSAPAIAADGTLRAFLGAYLPTSDGGDEIESVEDCFARRVADARARAVRGELGAAATIALQGCQQLMKVYPIEKHDIKYRLLRDDPSRRSALGSIILTLLRSNVVEEALWGSAVAGLLSVLRPLHGEPSSAAKEYLQFHQLPALGSLRNSSTEFVLETDDKRRVAVQIKTIHAVKGETHRATLVLETFNRTHDIKKLVPYLCGTQQVTGKEAAADQQRLKMIYVALSRPQHLVCLAMNVEHVTDKQLKTLASRWNIVRLGDSSPL